jgi:predicted dinucleotide-binding enzyme
VVKAFNTMFYKRLAEDSKPKGDKGRLAIPVASDDPAAKRVVMDLIDAIGFDPIDNDGLVAGGRKQQPGSPIYNMALGADEIKSRLALA